MKKRGKTEAPGKGGHQALESSIAIIGENAENKTSAFMETPNPDRGGGKKEKRNKL